MHANRVPPIQPHTDSAVGKHETGRQADTTRASSDEQEDTRHPGTYGPDHGVGHQGSICIPPVSS